MHGDSDDMAVIVRKRDANRWNAAADVVEKSTFLMRAMGWMAASIATGAGFLVVVKQYMGFGK